MGYGVETVCGSYAAAAAVGAQAYTPANDQSFNVRALAPNSKAHIESIWTQSQDPGYTRIRSPRMHDDVVGLQLQHAVGLATPIAQDCLSQEVFSQDALTVEDFFTTAPTAADVQQVGFQVYYDDVPGIAANIKSWAEIEPLIQSYYGALVSIVGNATIGEWAPGLSINSSQDNFKANSWYAILGYEVSEIVTAISFQGTDIGNLRLGGPGAVDPLVTRNWFIDLEETSGRPSIPVINSQNKGATLVSTFDIEASETVEIGVFYAYLGPTGA